MKKKSKGTFIVLDGSDGSGKATQTELLLKRLRREGVTAKKIDFPGYERNVFGKLVGECLAGKHGDFLHSDPHIASTLYAVDRFESKQLIEGWLSKGFVVIADRYVSSNQIHQGGKIKDKKQKKAFLKWLDTIEYEVFKIPRPDLILYLHVPVAITIQLLEKKSAAKKKRYLEGSSGKDTVESDMQYLENARQSALEVVQTANNWKKIECTVGATMKSREDINELIFNEVSKVLRGV